MNLKYMPDALIASLKHDFERITDRYSSSTPWINDYAKEKGLPGLQETEIEVPEEISLLDEMDKALADTDAAVVVYSALKSLTPVQAGDERLWAGLCHSEPFYSYARARWWKEKSTAKTLQRRFLLESRGVGGLSKNSISRLWWYGYLTVENSSDNPYLYTKMLLEYQDTPVGLLERNLGKNGLIVRQASKYICERASTWKDRSQAIQQFCKNINTAGGAIILDALDVEALYSLFKQCDPQPVNNS